VRQSECASAHYNADSTQRRRSRSRNSRQRFCISSQRARSHTRTPVKFGHLFNKHRNKPQSHEADMNSILTQPNFEYALFAAAVLLIVATTAALLYARGRKLQPVQMQEPARSTPETAKISHATAMSQAGATLPDYPKRLERRNREALATRSAAATARRPGVAARWKSQNRVAIGM
jgi:hypothetical protein